MKQWLCNALTGSIYANITVFKKSLEPDCNLLSPQWFYSWVHASQILVISCESCFFLLITVDSGLWTIGHKCFSYGLSQLVGRIGWSSAPWIQALTLTPDPPPPLCPEAPSVPSSLLVQSKLEEHSVKTNTSLLQGKFKEPSICL